MTSSTGSTAPTRTAPGRLLCWRDRASRETGFVSLSWTEKLPTLQGMAAASSPLTRGTSVVILGPSPASLCLRCLAVAAPRLGLLHGLLSILSALPLVAMNLTRRLSFPPRGEWAGPMLGTPRAPALSRRLPGGLPVPYTLDAPSPRSVRTLPPWLSLRRSPLPLSAPHATARRSACNERSVKLLDFALKPPLRCPRVARLAQTTLRPRCPRTASARTATVACCRLLFSSSRRCLVCLKASSMSSWP
mmetsp:Transcript_14210/g.29806  ORF Transcript_14210/g.29806 Transcript_14210/m.29806 type:complete len:247 (+) Transcript_14210:206-946(+)